MKDWIKKTGWFAWEDENSEVVGLQCGDVLIDGCSFYVWCSKEEADHIAKALNHYNNKENKCQN